MESEPWLALDLTWTLVTGVDKALTMDIHHFLLMQADSGGQAGSELTVPYLYINFNWARLIPNSLMTEQI